MSARFPGPPSFGAWCRGQQAPGCGRYPGSLCRIPSCNRSNTNDSRRPSSDRVGMVLTPLPGGGMPGKAGKTGRRTARSKPTPDPSRPSHGNATRRTPARPSLDAGRLCTGREDRTRYGTLGRGRAATTVISTRVPGARSACTQARCGQFAASPIHSHHSASIWALFAMSVR